MFAKATVVLFAGAGGSCIGLEQAYVRGGFDDRYVDMAINHWDTAVGVHELNHPMTEHLRGDVREIDPRSVLLGREIGVLWLSPDCTDFSKAKGGKPKRKHIRGLAWVGITWAQLRRPDVIFLENVEEFAEWGPVRQVRRNGKYLWDVHDPRKTGKHAHTTVEGPAEASAKSKAWRSMQQAGGCVVTPVAAPDRKRRGITFKQWKAALEGLGYVVEHRERRAKGYGAPTTRKRLFVIARCDGKEIIWPEYTHGHEEARCRGRSRTQRDSADGADSKGEGGGWQSRRGRLPVAGRRLDRRDEDADGRFRFEGAQRGLGAEVAAAELKPYRTTAECIDWKQPMLSIFATRPDAVRWTKRVNVGRAKHERLGVPQRSLKPKTHKRIAGGFWKWVLDAIEPFIVRMENFGWEDFTDASIEEPLSTITAGPRGGKHALVDCELTSFASTLNHGGDEHRGADLRGPMATITAANDARAMVAAELAPLTVPRYGEREGQAPRSGSVNEPHPTIVGTGNGAQLVAVALNKHYTGVIGQAADQPIGTITSKDHHSVMAVSLESDTSVPFGVRCAHGEQSASGNRWGAGDHDLQTPLGTVTGSNDYALVAAHTIKFRGESPGTGLGDPIDTITADGHGMGAACCFLSHQYTSNTNGGQGDPRLPLKTVTSAGHHSKVCVVYISPYYGEGSGQTGHTPAEPMPTATAKARFGLVALETVKHWIFTPKALARAKQVATWAIKHLGTKVEKHLLWVLDSDTGKKFAIVTLMVEGSLRIVSDILIRMFAPRELLLCQGFPPEYRVDVTVDGKYVTKADQVKLIGNSVPPQFPEVFAYWNVVMQGVLGPPPARKGVRT
jgi:DNA (cytosine-5)-methyltransferase 1